MAVVPKRLTLRAYGVGLGDCLLLTFHYGGRTGDRHMLIDFGSTQKPPNAPSNLMTRIADDIAAVTRGRLDILVATHRPTDHVSGFATTKNGKGPGDRIAALKPSMVIQPWTEQPDGPKRSGGRVGKVDAAWTTSLALMQDVAVAALRESTHLDRRLKDQINLVGANRLANMSAVKNLARMGKRGQAVYAHYGTRLALGKLLPGVRVKVLGPPTLQQKAGIAHQPARNRDEYGHFHKFWRLAADTAAMHDGSALFPKAAVFTGAQMPPETRWFVRRLKQARGEQLLRVVRAMDDALNNTSVILLIEAGGRKFLFPGDAHWENWEYAVTRNAADLKDVDFYKVGHHGSLNATPRTLWNLFTRRGDRAKRRRLTTLVSTRSNAKHSQRDTNTEVPRKNLLAELRRKSNFHSTQELENGDRLRLELVFDLQA